MSTKERALERPRVSVAELFAAPAAKRALLQAAYFLAGLICSHGVVFGRYAPFGIAAVAAAPYANLWSVVAGTVLGYLLPSSAQVPVRYIAAVLAAAAIRWTLNDLVKIKRHPFFAPLITFAPIFATGLALALVNGTPAGGMAMYAAESLLAGGCSYFFARTSELVMSGKGLNGLKNQELVSLTMSLGVLVLSLSDLTIAGISIGRILAVIIILMAARYGGVAGGGISGIAAGVVLSLSTAGLNYLSGAYALGGLMAGVFSPIGKLAAAVAFVFSNAVASLQVGNQAAVLNGLYEVMAATVVYMVWPAHNGNRISAVFSRPADVLHSDGLRRSVIMKLDFAAKALGNVSESVEAVSKKLDQICAPDINGVYKKAIDQVCCSCGLKVYCWERNYNDSMNAFNDLTPCLRAKGKAEKEDFPEQFSSHCSRLDSVLGAVNRNYSEFITRQAADRRVAQVRSVVTEQFGTTAELLNNMAQELELFERFDFSAAQAVNQVLHDAGIIPIDVSCRVDRYDRMSIEIEAAQVDRSRLNKAGLAKQISKACGRAFDAPCVGTAQGKYRLQMSERPVYRIQAGVAQHVCGNAQLCGDSYECFPDGSGRQIAIISDGMGTGGRAAVDGAMAAGMMATLIKAGIGFDCALKIVNSALLVKSGDESLATVDMAAIDLFSGKAELMKAGAPASMARKSGKAVKIDAPSLPVGILNETSFARESVKLAADDLLVLYSDGVTAGGEDWLAELLEGWKGEVPQELAESIVSQAISQRSDGHDDDITVVVIKLAEPHLE